MNPMTASPSIPIPLPSTMPAYYPPTSAAENLLHGRNNEIQIGHVNFFLPLLTKREPGYVLKY